MAKLLHIAASPKGEHSNSAQLADWFLSSYRRAHPADDITVLNVFDERLPVFAADGAAAKFAPLYGTEKSDQQKVLWKQVEARIAEFDSADRIVISSPMWNFSVPYPLKHYIDILVQPGLTFGYDAESMMHLGLLRNRPVQLLLTRSSIPPGDYGDFQLPYLRYVLNFIGLRDVRALTAWQTTQPTAEGRAAYVAAFREECERLGAGFV